MARLRARWTIHAPLRCAVTPTKWTLWVLAHPFVAPTAQNQGVGRALLEHALAYAKESEPGLIVSSPDPRAIRRYASAGFALHPTVGAGGILRRVGLGAAPDVRCGDETDLESTAPIDRQVRGAARIA